MKRIIYLAAMFLLAYGVSHAQETIYKGCFHFTGANASNAAYYTNLLKVAVRQGGAATATIELKMGSKTDPEDYVLLSGTLEGTFSATGLSATGNLTQVMQEGVRIQKRQERSVPAELKGTTSGTVVNGTMYLIYDGRKEGGFEFTFPIEEPGPELLFPLGKSPKVFDKGWLFGAAFKLTDENGEEIDISDKIEWSGTGSFEPDKGSRCRPAFYNIGENKIILSVEYEGKIYKKEYPVITVEALKYARVSSFAMCPADSHGSLADPMCVVGWVVSGNGNVLIDGLPAACEGDRGMHVACAGPNTFVISSEGCDWEVLINGKKAAKKGSLTRHCGGWGEITNLVSSVEAQNMFLALSDDISFTNKDGKKIPQNSNPEAGTKMLTGPNGLLLMSPDRNTVLMLLPNSSANISNNTDKDLYITLNGGSVFINGEKADKSRNLVIESFNEKLIRKGTRFLFTRTGDTSKLIVYEGEVDVLLKKDNSTITVPAGKVYYNDSKSPYVIKDTARFESSAVLMTIPKDSFNIKWNEKPSGGQTNASQNNDFLSLLKQYWYVGAGIVVLLLAVWLLRKRKP